MNMIKKFAPIGAVLLAIVAIVMGFMTGAVAEEGSLKMEITLWELVFGYDFEMESISMNVVGFSFLNLIPFLCVLAGAALLVLNFMGKGSDLFAIVAAVLFVVAAVFFFLVIANAQMGSYYTEMAQGMPEEQVKEGWNKVKEAFDLGVGAILAAIASIIAAVCAAAPVVLDKMGK